MRNIDQVREYCETWITELWALREDLLIRCEVLQDDEKKQAIFNLSNTEIMIRKLQRLLKGFPKERKTDTWYGYLQSLEHDDIRAKESRQAEILKLAMQKAKERMAKYHTYRDGEIDRVLLNSETVCYE